MSNIQLRFIILVHICELKYISKLICNSYFVPFNMIGVLANAPKMLWTDCPEDSSCNRCLDIAFESENDIACLHQKYPENGCVFDGALMNGGSMVAVSSDECFIDGTLENIQVSL